jgi:hypothetical protein
MWLYVHVRIASACMRIICVCMHKNFWLFLSQVLCLSQISVLPSCVSVSSLNLFPRPCLSLSPERGPNEFWPWVLRGGLMNSGSETWDTQRYKVVSVSTWHASKCIPTWELAQITAVAVNIFSPSRLVKVWPSWVEIWPVVSCDILSWRMFLYWCVCVCVLDLVQSVLLELMLDQPVHQAYFHTQLASLYLHMPIHQGDLTAPYALMWKGNSDTSWMQSHSWRACMVHFGCKYLCMHVFVYACMYL